MEKAAKTFGVILALAAAFALVQWLFGTTEDRQWKISIVAFMGSWALWAFHMAGLWNPVAAKTRPLWMKASLIASGIALPAYLILLALGGGSYPWLGILGGACFMAASMGALVRGNRGR